MMRQSRHFRRFLKLVMWACLLCGSSLWVWQYVRHIPSAEIRREFRRGAKITVHWTEDEVLWQRLGYMQLGVGACIATFLTLTHDPYRDLKAKLDSNANAAGDEASDS